MRDSSEGIRTNGISPLKQSCAIHGNRGPSWHIIHTFGHNFERLIEDFLDLGNRGDFHGCCGKEIFSDWLEPALCRWVHYRTDSLGCQPLTLSINAYPQSDRQYVAQNGSLPFGSRPAIVETVCKNNYSLPFSYLQTVSGTLFHTPGCPNHPLRNRNQ